MNEACIKNFNDFDTDLQTRFSSSLFQFILATDEIQMECFMIRCAASGAMPPAGFAPYLGRELTLLEDYREQQLHKLGS